MARIRITGGAWRSRLIKVADHLQGLRPTPDRVRVTLFNWLGQDLNGLRCLDLFAGSGMLGFEAASRGAAHVTFVEQAPEVFRQLQQNACALVPDVAGRSDDRLELVRTDALKFALTVNRPYDLVFLDPPYHQGWLERMAPLLDRLATSEARIYVEAEDAVESIGPWQKVKQGQAGQVFYQLLELPCPIEPLSIQAPSTL